MYPILNGEYEAIVGEMYNNGNRITIDFIIRNDVAQNEKNKVVKFYLYRSADTGFYDGASGKQLMAIETALRTVKRPYKNFNDMALNFIGKCCRITVKNEIFNGKPVIKIRHFDKTKYPECKHLPPEPVETDGCNRFANI